MHADDVLLGRGEKAVGIVVAQVRLLGEGQQAQVLQGADIAGLHASGLHALAIDGHVLVDAADGLLQPFQLQGLQRGAVHGLYMLVPDVGAWLLHSLSLLPLLEFVLVSQLEGGHIGLNKSGGHCMLERGEPQLLIQGQKPCEHA